MEIEIRPIKIQLDTNIPGKPLVELKKSILYNPVLQNTTSFSEYPYFTMDVEYPSIHLNSLSYEKRLEFFFNKDIMLKTLKTFRSSYFTQPKKDEVKIETLSDKNAKDEETKYEKEKESLEAEIKKLDSEIKNEDSEKKEIDINYEQLITLLQNVKGDLDEIFQKKDGLGRADKNTLKTGVFVKTYIDVFDSCIKYKTKYTDALKKTKDDVLKEIATDFEGKLKDFITGKRKDREGSNIKEIMAVFEDDIEKNAGQNMEKAKSILNKSITNINAEKKTLENEKNKKTKELQQKINENKVKNLSSETKEKKKKEDIKESVTMIDDEKKEIQLKNSENNIMLMLRLLFPIKYPIVGDVSSSFNQIIMNKTEISTTFNDFLPAFLKNKLVPGIADYSYLKIDGKVYTITQAIWLNDIYNHKEYSKLIEQYKQLNKQKQNDSSKLITENGKLLTKFRNDYGKNSKTSFDDKAVRFFNDLFEKLDNKSSSVVETDAQKNAGLLKQFIESIKTFNDSIDDKEKKIIDAAKNMVDIYKTLPGTFKQNTTYTNIITSMTMDIDKIRMNDYIHVNYIGAPGINLNYKDDEAKYIEILKSKYSYYTSFVDSIKQFRAPAKISTNYVLQDTINDFLDNIEEYSFGKNMGPFSFMMNPYNIDVNPFSTVPVNANDSEKKKYADEKKKYKRRMNTGVTILTSATDPKYEIFVQINVIAGELNDTNTKLVDCLYKGEMLGERLEYLLNKTLGNPWDIKSTRLFFDISQGDVKNEIVKAKEKEAIANQPIVPNQQPIAANQQPIAANQQPIAANQQPIAANQQPIAANQQPIAANQMKMQGGGSLSRKMRTNLIRKTFKSYIY